MPRAPFNPSTIVVPASIICGVGLVLIAAYYIVMFVWHRFIRRVHVRLSSGVFIGDPITVALTVGYFAMGETVELTIQDDENQIVHVERLVVPKQSGLHLRGTEVTFKPLPTMGRCRIVYRLGSGATRGIPVEFDIRMPVVELAVAGDGAAPAGSPAGSEPRWGDPLEVLVSCSAQQSATLRSGADTVTLRRRDGDAVDWSATLPLTGARAVKPSAPAADGGAGGGCRSVAVLFQGSYAPPEPGAHLLPRRESREESVRPTYLPPPPPPRRRVRGCSDAASAGTNP